MDRAYLSIVDWPSGWGEDRKVEALAAGAGIDPASCRLIVARGTPQVAWIIDPSVREEVVSALRALGVLAFAPTRAEMRAWPAPERVKRLFVFEDRSAIGVEFWRGEAAVVRADDVRLIVRGSPRSTRIVADSAPGGLDLSLPPEAMAADLLAKGAVREVRTTRSELLDLHVFVGDGTVRVLRVDADKMSFDVLGGERGLSDRENMTRLTALLGEVAPRAGVDVGFDRFSPPPEVAARRGAAARTAGFDFYSVWLALLHRELGAL